MNIPSMLLLSLTAFSALPAAAEAPAPGLWQINLQPAEAGPAPQGLEDERPQPPAGSFDGKRRPGFGHNKPEHTVCLTGADDPNALFTQPPRNPKGDRTGPTCAITYSSQTDGAASWRQTCETPMGPRAAEGQAQFSAELYSANLSFAAETERPARTLTLTARRMGDCPTHTN